MIGCPALEISFTGTDFEATPSHNFLGLNAESRLDGSPSRPWHLGRRPRGRALFHRLAGAHEAPLPVLAASGRGVEALRPRTDLFGFANYTGLAAVLIAVLLLALSNDYFLRTLGSARWKRLQRWNYAFNGLVLLHGIAFQLIEKRKGAFVITMSILVIAASVFQVLGYTRRRASRGMARNAAGQSRYETGLLVLIAVMQSALQLIQGVTR
jgi:hypothetical protein